MARAPALILLIAFLPLSLVSCRTAPIPDFAPIPVPPGLSMQQVELAILSAILNKPPPSDIDPRVTLPDDGFQALVWQHYLSDARSRSWFPESREPGIVRAAVNRRGHYLRVALSFDQSYVRSEIEESRELLQTKTHIHRRAITWMNWLHERIRRELGRMAYPGRAQG